MTTDMIPRVLPTFETRRLRVRPMRVSDAGAISEFKGDPMVTGRYGQDPKTPAETRKWVKERVGPFGKTHSMFWVFEVRPDPTPVGSCCLWNFDREVTCAELGYELHRDHWGKGITAEGLRPVVDFGFRELRLHRIEACPFAENAASGRVLLKLGFRYEGSLRQRFRFRGQYLDQLYYSILDQEWKPLPPG